jgi:hypothetical protein
VTSVVHTFYSTRERNFQEYPLMTADPLRRGGAIPFLEFAPLPALRVLTRGEAEEGGEEESKQEEEKRAVGVPG